MAIISVKNRTNRVESKETFHKLAFHQDFASEARTKDWKTMSCKFKAQESFISLDIPGYN